MTFSDNIRNKLTIVPLIFWRWALSWAPLTFWWASGAAQAQKVSGCKDPKISQKWPLNSNFCFVLHFYTTIFKSQWVHLHPLHPQLRGPCLECKSWRNWVQCYQEWPFQEIFTKTLTGLFTRNFQLIKKWKAPSYSMKSLHRIRWSAILIFSGNPSGGTVGSCPPKK